MPNTRNDKLDYMLYMVAAECCKTDVEKFDSIDDSNVSFTPDFYRKQNRIIRKYKYRPMFKAIKKIASKVAIVLMIILSTGFITVMAVEPLREALYETIIEWYEDYLTIRFEPIDRETEDTAHINTETENGDTEERVTENASSNSATETVNDESDPQTEITTEKTAEVVTPPTTIEEVRKPTYIPDGVVEDVFLQNNAIVCIDYYLKNELIYSFNQLLIKDRDKYIDNQAVLINYIEINGNEAVVFEYSDKSEISLVWTDNEYAYHIYSQSLDIDSLISIAESVN